MTDHTPRNVRLDAFERAWKTADQPASPLAALDLAAALENADELTRLGGGLPLRLATKSIRCRPLIEHILKQPGFRGLMAYSAAEALWLSQWFDDIYIAYPTADIGSVEKIAADETARARITFTVDSHDHLVVLQSAGGGKKLRVSIDVDASLRVGPLHLGVRRSPIRKPAEARALAETAQVEGLNVVGVMFYDAQIAGVPDTSPAVRAMKRRSHKELLARRAAVVEAVKEVADLEFVNGGGTGSLSVTGADGVLTELAAGSGIYSPTLFDRYDSLNLRPSLVFALPVVRRPAVDIATVSFGGYVASGPTGDSRLPTPILPSGLKYLSNEGAGEVQTPLKGTAAQSLSVGDLVWFRPAKAGESLERFDELHILEGDQFRETWPTYRGEGKNFG